MADQSLPDTIEKANDESMYYDGMKQDEGIWKPPQKMSKVHCPTYARPPFTRRRPLDSKLMFRNASLVGPLRSART